MAQKEKKGAVKSAIKRRMNLKAKGFTLIEVLIALVIFIIALTTLIKFTSQYIRDTHYIHDKMIASWVGTNIINEIRAGITAPQAINMLGETWSWQATKIRTPNPRIQQLQVSVFQINQSNPIITLTSYIYAK